MAIIGNVSLMLNKLSIYIKNNNIVVGRNWCVCVHDVFTMCLRCCVCLR